VGTLLGVLTIQPSTERLDTHARKNAGSAIAVSYGIAELAHGYTSYPLPKSQLHYMSPNAMREAE